MVIFDATVVIVSVRVFVQRGDECPCPPVRNDIVTPGYFLFRIPFHQPIDNADADLHSNAHRTGKISHHLLSIQGTVLLPRRS